GAVFAGEQRKENAAAENRINETSGVTREHPAVACETTLTIGKIRARISGRDAPGVCHALGQKRLFGNLFLEEFLGRFLRLPEECSIENDPDAGAILRERDIPKPAVGRAQLAGERALPPLVSPPAFVVREDGDLLQVSVSFLQLEMSAEYRMAAARVDHVARSDLVVR